MKRYSIGHAVAVVTAATFVLSASPAAAQFVRPDLHNGYWLQQSTGGSSNTVTMGGSSRFGSDYLADRNGYRGTAFNQRLLSGARFTVHPSTGVAGLSIINFLLFHPDKYQSKRKLPKPGATKSQQKKNVGFAFLALASTFDTMGSVTATASASGIAEDCSAKAQAKGTDTSTMSNTNDVSVAYKCKGTLESALGLTGPQAATLIDAINNVAGAGTVVDAATLASYMSLPKKSAVPFTAAP